MPKVRAAMLSCGFDGDWVGRGHDPGGHPLKILLCVCRASGRCLEIVRPSHNTKVNFINLKKLCGTLLRVYKVSKALEMLNIPSIKQINYLGQPAYITVAMLVIKIILAGRSGTQHK